MKQILVIGSTVVDVIVNLPHLPVTGEDVHVTKQILSLGGCAYNVFHIIRHFKIPGILFSPIGTGTYGDFVRTELSKRKVQSPIPTPPQENGCCYCFVEETGERTFASYHGAEYLFRREWFDMLDADSIDCVYICGLEIEETTGEAIISYLEEHKEFKLYFAPGPRMNRITESRLSRIFALHPILHLNQEEAMAYTGCSKTEEAALSLYRLTNNSVIITLGCEGAYCYDGRHGLTVPGQKAVQADTIGAGDSHIGSVIACMQKGFTLIEAVEAANKVSAAVVEVPGALLSDLEFSKVNPFL